MHDQRGYSHNQTDTRFYSFGCMFVLIYIHVCGSRALFFYNRMPLIIKTITGLLGNAPVQSIMQQITTLTLSLCPGKILTVLLSINLPQTMQDILYMKQPGITFVHV